MEDKERSNEVREKPDSVELSKNAKGDLVFKIKCYFPTDATSSERVDKVEEIRIVAESKWGIGRK